MKLDLFHLARANATVRAACSCKPHRILRRAKNIVVGRALARVGFWRRLWG